ncbi:MAG: O-antigen ligase family protein [Solirubrobacteraceae bacterium]
MHEARPALPLRPHIRSGLPGLLAVGLMLVWAAHDGGFDADTWYWGALATLGLLAAALVALSGARPRLPRAGVVALALLALYVAWSYLSIAWAQSPGDALQGSNRALLYLLLFALMLVLPWTPQSALVALLTFAIGVGAIGVVLMVRLASDDRIASLVVAGRLAAPTGYYNATAALFMVGALVGTGLACRRQLPGPVRGLLLALACAGLQLALIVQSRGWLFTLPLVVLAAIAVSADRLRLAVYAIIPIAAALVGLHRLLDVFQSSAGAGLGPAAARAGQAGLIICGAALVLGTLLAWGDSLLGPRTLSAARRRAIGTLVSVVAGAGVLAAGAAATHGHPVRFVVRQWNGFKHPETKFSSRSHFGDVGSGRYDFWRVSLDAALAHPVGGLGQDNFADYYVEHRRTDQEPSWTHSLEMRLLAHTGFVGLALFLGFLVAALALALRARRLGDALVRGLAGVALLPLVVWLIHGSVDWFWEIPALSGPALGFLGMAGALGVGRRQDDATLESEGARSTATTAGAERPGELTASRTGVLARPTLAIAGATALLAGVIVLGFSYLSVREVSLASDARFTDAAGALKDLTRAAKLDPLSSEPGRLAGAIALQNGEYTIAQQRFRQSISREPGGWFAWLGAGLASSALGESARAHRDFAIAYSINSRQPAIRQALVRANSARPLTSTEAFKLLVLVQ